MVYVVNASTPRLPMEAPPQQKKPWAENYQDFINALDILYINGNLSGRLHFRRDWPAAAAYVFGPELMKYDEDGPRDKEHRALMEVEAEERRMILMDALVDLEEKSVYHGSLQPEHVKKTVTTLGRRIALYVYADFVVDDIIPPKPDDRKVGEEVESVHSENYEVKERIVSVLPSPPIPVLSPLEEDIQPIDVAPAAVGSIEGATGNKAGGSGLNLAAKRNIVQVDFIHSKPLSYADLVAKAEKEPAESSEKVIPQPGIEVTADPPVPLLQSASAATAPSVQKLLSLRMMFNQLAAGLVS